MYDAAVVAGRHFSRGPNKIKLIAYSIFTCFFAPMGATMIFWVIVQMSGGISFSDLPLAALPITLLAFGALAMWLMREVHSLATRAAVTTRFGHAYDLVLSADGFTLTTQYSRWHSGWADVEMVGRGKTVIAITISGIAIAVPRHAFLGPKDADDALNTMRAWHEAAQ
jgi:hypothetical protein